jgi:hypothetical protein
MLGMLEPIPNSSCNTADKHTYHAEILWRNCEKLTLSNWDAILESNVTSYKGDESVVQPQG